MRFKRPTELYFCLQDCQFFDLKSLLQGRVETETEAQLLVISPLTFEQHRVDPEQLGILRNVPCDLWSEGSQLAESLGVEVEDLEQLALKALLLADADDPSLLRQLRHRAELLSAQGWHPLAAIYHFQNRSLDESAGISSLEARDYGALEATAVEDAAKFVARHGPPPPLFHRISRDSGVELPLVEKKGGLYDLLRQRRTTRAFDAERPMSLEDLAVVLRWTFGYHGYLRLSEDVTLLNRTSPSGGARHPIEAYLLISNVSGLETGLYHYDPEDHILEPIRELEQEAARSLAVDCARQQTWAGAAHVLLFMTARYFRNFWKYRNNLRTYSIVLMDAAHLNQTLALIATDLGLASVYSAAIHAPRIENALGLDGYEEGAIACCGFGPKPGSYPDHGIERRAFVPRKTKI